MSTTDTKLKPEVSIARLEVFHKTAWKGVIAITGGGTGAIDLLLRNGGGSSTLLEAIVPYSPEAWGKLLGRIPDKMVSAAAARQLAMASLHQAIKLAGHSKDIFGVGATCSLTKGEGERPGRRHDLHVAVVAASSMTYFCFEMDPDTRRNQEDSASAQIVNFMLYQFLGSDWPTVGARCLARSGVFNGACLEDCISRKGYHISKSPAIQWGRRLIFPGSFNPVHQGHLEMMRIAEKKTGMKGAFEIAIFNADKGMIDPFDLQQREKQFEELQQDLVLTNAPLFHEKAMLFPSTTFVVGADTWHRIMDPKYYVQRSFKEVIQDFSDYGTRFLVFPRKIGDTIVTMGAFNPKKLARAISPEEFCMMDISSTQIRNQQGKPL